MNNELFFNKLTTLYKSGVILTDDQEEGLIEIIQRFPNTVNSLLEFSVVFPYEVLNVLDDAQKGVFDDLKKLNKFISYGPHHVRTEVYLSPCYNKP